MYQYSRQRHDQSLTQSCLRIHWRRPKADEVGRENLFVSWCFEPCQPQMIVAGLKTNLNRSPSYSFHKFYTTSLFFSNHNSDSLHVYHLRWVTDRTLCGRILSTFFLKKKLSLSICLSVCLLMKPSH